MPIRGYTLAAQLGLDRREFLVRARALGVDLLKPTALVEDLHARYLHEHLEPEAVTRREIATTRRYLWGGCVVWQEPREIQPGVRITAGSERPPAPSEFIPKRKLLHLMLTGRPGSWERWCRDHPAGPLNAKHWCALRQKLDEAKTPAVPQRPEDLRGPPLRIVLWLYRAIGTAQSTLEEWARQKMQDLRQLTPRHPRGRGRPKHQSGEYSLEVLMFVLVGLGLSERDAAAVSSDLATWFIGGARWTYNAKARYWTLAPVDAEAVRRALREVKQRFEAGREPKSPGTASKPLPHPR